MSLITNYEPVVVTDTTNLSEQEWLEYRRKGIGGSDAAAVLGLSPFCTSRDLYYDKIGVKPVIGEEQNYVAKQVGKLLEPLVGEIFSRKTGLKIYREAKLYSHPLYPFMLANIDYIVAMPDGTLAVLECKTTNYNNQDKWANGAVPINYELQGRHYMPVRNVNTVFFACLYGNSENEFVYRRIDRDMDYEQDIIEQERYFWEEHVQKKIVPPYTENGNLVLESIRRKYGNADASAPVINIDGNMAEIIERYLALREQKLEFDHKSQDIEDEMKKAYAPILDIMGSNCSAVCLSGSSEYLITYNPSYRESINKDGLEALKVFNPEIYKKYISTTESRRFAVKKKGLAA